MNIITNLTELLSILELNKNENLLKMAHLATHRFSLLAPESFIQKIQKGDINDPLLRQILPDAKELLSKKGYKKDPLNENLYNPAPNILHKYRGRALLLVTQNCALHCRFCFRRNLMPDKNTSCENKLERAFSYIENDKSLTEIILSGGDPLLLTNEKLHIILQTLAEIRHIKRVRIHTRIPIAMPKKITPSLLEGLTSTRFSPIIVLHCNHAAEIDKHTYDSVNLFRKSLITVLNQSVLLKGVNDSAASLCELSEKLGDIGVIPYYLHLLDKVDCASHFAVSVKKAKILHKEISGLLPGYLVPKLVCDKEGMPSKCVL